MKYILRHLKITRIKLFLASVLYHLVKAIYQTDQQTIRRHGINYVIDLNEGIDLHLFLFGNFQKHITDNKVMKIPDDAVIFDVGANSGIMSLSFATKAPKGEVHAFEPTNYALKKLEKNLNLNPQLKKRIHTMQTFVSSETRQESGLRAYSSWPVKTNEKKNKIHRGVDKTTRNVGSITLDAYSQEKNIQRLDLIKIDTDGHELEVLKGCASILEKFRPIIIFELGVYVMDERHINFNDYSEYFEKFDYNLFTPGAKQIKPANYRDFVPQYGTIDIIALPGSNSQLKKD
jgi:FkbM family methyltransferase